MLFTKNALLVQILALHLGNSLQTGVGLPLLGADEQESRVCWAPQHWPCFPSLSYGITAVQWVRAGTGVRRLGIESLFLCFLAGWLWANFRNPLDHTTHLMGLFWHLNGWILVHIKFSKHAEHAESALQLLTLTGYLPWARLTALLSRFPQAGGGNGQAKRHLHFRVMSAVGQVLRKFS